MSKAVERNMREYWNRRASSYPRYEAGEDTHEARMLKIIKEHGIDFSGMKVLDVGSGSGKYTIRIAEEADEVTALDISDEMLEILKEDARKEGLKNIKYINSDWEDFESSDKYDLIFCSMTPALRNEIGREKIKDYAKNWVVYMGFINRAHSDISMGLYEAYNTEPREFNSALAMKDWLEDKGIKYSSYPVKGEWVKVRSHDEMLSQCMADVYNFGGSPDEEAVTEYLLQFKRDTGDYLEKTGFEIDLIIWQSK